MTEKNVMDKDHAGLSREEQITAAYMHFVRGIEQQDIATIYDVHSGRVSECCRAIGAAVGLTEPGYKHRIVDR